LKTFRGRKETLAARATAWEVMPRGCWIPSRVTGRLLGVPILTEEARILIRR
jgi:hypothetical protein